MGVVRHWGRVREVGDAPSLETPEVRAGWGSEYLVGLWVSLFTAGQWDPTAFKSPFQLTPFYMPPMTM